jgi:hypothetical protein
LVIFIIIKHNIVIQPMSNLFLVVYVIAQDSGYAIDSDERVFLDQLYRVVKQTKTRQSLLSTVSTMSTDSDTLQEEHLPLVARYIQRTIGLIDADGEVVIIPNQWFATNQADEYAEVIRKSVCEDGSVVYEQDYDEQYVAKYEQYIQQHGYAYYTDSIRIRLGGVDDTSSSSSSSSLASLSNESIAQIVNVKMKTVRYDKDFETRFLDVWGSHYYFPDTQQTSFPHIHDDHFHRKLYGHAKFNYATMLQHDSTQKRTVATYKDHQQLVRNFMSPMTPYHSLLLIHATGTGKTLTTFGITEQFRDLTYAQNKKIHIACPKHEICQEFISYLNTSENETHPVKQYIQSTYADEVADSKHDFEHKYAAQYALDHYRIETYYSIFPKPYYTYVNHLKRLVHSWRVILPTLHTIQRTDYGFRLGASNMLTDQIPILQKILDTLATDFAKHFKEIWKYTIDAVDTENVNIHVTEIHSLVHFEKQIIDEYSDSVFVVDEAHRLIDTIGSSNSDSDSHTESYENKNWRIMLYIIVSILRYHRCRMRILLLTATPMINSDDDFFELLNLLIYNDGIQNEKPFPIMKNMSSRLSHKRRHSAQFIRSIQARVSYFKNSAGKPKQLFAEDVFYNVPFPASQVSVLRRTLFPIILIPQHNVFLENVDNFQTHTIVWDQFTSTSTKHRIPLEALLNTDVTQPHQVYVYVLLNSSVPLETQIRWCTLCGSYLHARHTVIVVGLRDEQQVLRTLSQDCRIQQGLYAQTSIRHPLVAGSPTQAKRSMYHTNHNPTIYATSLHNMDVLLKTYMTHIATDLQNLQYNPSVVATPMQNRAVFTDEKDKTLKYNLANQLIHNWNVNDKTDTVYQPKIDTMLSIMEQLPGNILIYTNEVRLDAKHKTGARILNFLKRRIKDHYAQNKRSRLHKVVVEILHKETLHHLNEGDMTIELNERIQFINKHVLSKRNDVILIGSKEIMEGLTMDEIRQVHILDPAWNMAQIEQVMGRAIRIGNHKKHKQKALHNVSCFLHISLPEQPFYHTASTTLLLQSLNPMERSFSDLHRYRLMRHKIKDVRETDMHIQSNAIDTVFLDDESQTNICVLTDNAAAATTNFPWKIVQHISSTSFLRDKITSLRSVYLKEPATMREPLSHASPYAVPEGMRNEIDWFKHSIPLVFETHRSHFQTFDEIGRAVMPYGHMGGVAQSTVSMYVSLDVEYYSYFLQKTGNTSCCTTHQEVLDQFHHFSQLMQQQLLLNVLLCQYKWYVQTHGTPSDQLATIRVDEVSVLTHPNWAHIATVIPVSLKKLAQSNGVSKHMHKIVRALGLHYVVPVRRGTSQHQTNRNFQEPTLNTLKHRYAYGLRLQNIHEPAVEYALRELVQQNTPIQLERSSYYMVYARPFYSLVPYHIPKASALWNVSRADETSQEHTELTPYSVSLEEEKEKTVANIRLFLYEIIRFGNILVEHLRTRVPRSTLLLYAYEYAFDSMVLQKQEDVLQYSAIHGVDSIFESDTRQYADVFRKSLSERFVEKGKKQTDTFPKHAQHILNEFFPNHSGRMFLKFPKNPASDTCAVHIYEDKGKKQNAQVVYNRKQVSANSPMYRYAVQYFSPIPVHNTSDQQFFHSSPNIHNISTRPIAPNTPLFGYNDVLNFKHKLASRLQMKVCVSDSIRDVPIDSPEVEAHLAAFQQRHRVFETTLLEAEQSLVGKIPTDEMVHVLPSVVQCCKYILLRHTNVFLRFFYAGIVTKHPNKEYYASYKHAIIKKLIG